MDDLDASALHELATRLKHLTQTVAALAARMEALAQDCAALCQGGLLQRREQVP